MTRTVVPKPARPAPSSLRALVESFGAPAPLPHDLVVRFGKAVLAVAGADGRLSEAEVSAFCGALRAWGATDAELDECLTFDYGSVDLQAVAGDAALRPLARLVLHDAIRVSAADGFGDGEREAATRMATRLGLDPAVVPSIEGLLGIEDAVRAARMRLLSEG